MYTFTFRRHAHSRLIGVAGNDAALAQGLAPALQDSCIAMTDAIRWGIIGSGRIARQFAGDFEHAASHAELRAVAARSRPDAIAFAQQWGAVQGFGDYREVFEHPEIDVVYIATPHALHFEHSAAALRAGKAVLCEKPLCLDAAQADALIGIARQHDRYLCEGMWTYFLPAVRRALQWVRDERIGTLVQVRSDFGYPLPYAPDRREYDDTLGGGALLEMGVYPASLACRLFPGLPERVQASARFAPNGVEDDVSVLLEYGDGIANLATSFRSKLPNIAYLVGTSGYIAIPDFWRARECHLFRLDDCVDSYRDARTGTGFEYEIDAVSDDIRQGRRESAIVPLAESLRVHQLVDRIKASLTWP